MKKIFKTAALFLISGLLFAGSALAVDLEWDPNADDQGVIGYYIYWQRSDGAGDIMQAQVDGRLNTHITIDDANFIYDIAYTMWATAFNTTEESDNSLPIEYARSWPGGNPIVPTQPGGLRFSDSAGTLIDPGKIRVAP